MSLPVMTPEQRADALAKAARARQERAAAKAALRSGTLTLAGVLADKDHPLQGARVREVLTSLPGIGQVKADKLLAEAGVDARRRVAGLGARQRQAVFGAWMPYRLYRGETACDSDDFGPPHGVYPTLALAMVATGLPVSAWQTAANCPDEIFTCKPDGIEVDWQLIAPGAAAEFTALTAA